MHKFRVLKSRLINSKRDSQKINEEQLLSMISQQTSLSRIKISYASKIQAEMNSLTQDHYKIYNKTNRTCTTNHSQRIKNSCHNKVCSSNLEMIQQNLQGLLQSKECSSKTYDQYESIDTMKKVNRGKHFLQSPIEGFNFTKILELMAEVNQLQQRKNHQKQHQADYFKEEIKKKLGEVKFLISTIEDQSQKNLLDFYNEESCLQRSPDSFNSQNSDQTYQQQTQREAYELGENRQAEGDIEIKYRRITADQESQHSRNTQGTVNETFYDEIQLESESEVNSPIRQNNIVHLFSIEKEKYLESPLSKISERSAQYYSPESKNLTSNSSVIGESLEYKKIFYLLETTEKKRQTTNRKEVSQFNPTESKLSFSINKTLNNDSKERNRCHQQLEEMINLLQTKYQRKIKIGAENIMNSLNSAIKEKTVKLRNRK